MRKIIAISTAASTYLFLAGSVFAQNVINISPPPQAQSLTNIPIGNIPQFLVTLLFIIAIVIAIVFLIYGGIKWILSGGDSKQVEGARSHIVAAIVGLIIVIGAFLILNVVFQVLTGTGFSFSNLCIPSLGKPTC